MKAERQLDWVEVPLEKIKPYKNNPKEHTQEQIDFVANLIQKFGWTQPICVDENYELIFGHCRLLAAKQLGEETAPVVFRKDLTPAQVKALRIADNKSNESEWQLDKLEIELAEIMALDVELQDVGFGFDELDDMRNANAKYEAKEDDFDIDGALEEELMSKTGDLWILGKHRVLCGDSTKAEDVARLMDGKKADIINTDPPYNQNREYGKSFDDNKTDAQYRAWSVKWFANCATFADNIAFSCGVKNIGMWYSIKPFNWVIAWMKRNAMLGSPFGFAGWEPVLFYGKAKQRGQDVIDAPIVVQEELKGLHDCPKQINYALGLIELTCDKGQLILDPFLGSGTTLIAADQLDRICYGMEISPKYCDVIVKRYISHSSKTDDVFLERNGEKIPFSECY